MDFKENLKIFDCTMTAEVACWSFVWEGGEWMNENKKLKIR